MKKTQHMSNLKDHLITAEESAALAGAYTNSNYAEINRLRPAGKPDSKVYRIDLAVLQDYIDLINREMEARGIKEKGIKITLGKYPDKSTDPRLKKEYEGYQMVFFSPADMAEESIPPKMTMGKMGEIPDLNFMDISPPKRFE